MTRHFITAVLLSWSLAGCASGRFGPSADIEVPARPHTLKKLSVEERRHAMERARVWQAIDTDSLDLIKGPDLPPPLRIGRETTCTFIHPAKPLSGNTPKFQCAVQKGDEVKVKYGEKNGEVYAEVAASRLLWALGFKADVMLPTRLTCLDCPVSDPFAVSATEWTRTGPRERTKRVFDPAIIEREITGKSIEVPGFEGWAWPELDQIQPREGAATRAHIDALKLLAVFIQHSDTKPDQQELVCAEGRNRKDARGNETCETAWLVIKDLGATFGKATRFNSSKMNLADWDSAKVWKPTSAATASTSAKATADKSVGKPSLCVGDLPRSLTGSLDNPVIGEAGRRFLARRLSQLRDQQIRDLFVASQIPRHCTPSSAPSGCGPLKANTRTQSSGGLRVVLSKSALIDGVEWNVRLSEVTSPDILEKFDATFDSYWQSAEYEDYNPAQDGDRLANALAPAADSSGGAPLMFLDVTPWPHQTEILEKLAAERERHRRFKNLVVAATGTGKTIVAALDFKRLRAQMGDPRLLFVAHRQEILKQSLSAFRQVLRDGSFGELYVDGHRPDEWRHVFASIQSLERMEVTELNPDAFDIVIVDEFHHAAAPTYRRVLERLFPSGNPKKGLPPPGTGNPKGLPPQHGLPPQQQRILLGLTATPERTDAGDILGFFVGHIAAELRLWDALERGLLCPFQYFGLSDNTDLSQVEWSRKGYSVSALENLYTGDEARVRLVLQQMQNKLRDTRTMRALGFCVSIAHAEFMARRFTEAGLPSQAVSANTDSDTRRQALADLQKGTLRALFAVDLFNEGVDLPAVDTLLFLRPTESALVFMQQLGRGLRRFEGKDCVTVLDFIGQSHRKFRFDLRYRAVTGASRSEVGKQIEQGFPFLPAGCTMQLDKVAKEVVLKSLRDAIPSQRPAMVRELQALVESEAANAGRPVTLELFLSETGLEPLDVFKHGSWSGLKRASGIDTPAPGPQEERLGKALRRLLHIDDPVRLTAYREWLVGQDADPRLITALLHTLWTDEKPDGLEAAALQMQAHPALVSDLLELLDILEERADHVTTPGDGIPLSIHSRHSLTEILSALGDITPDRFFQPQAGVYRHEATNSDLFFVTLEKSERDYSPSTLYKDYAISPTLFHWESQSITTQQSAPGQRYIKHRELGGQILLFVRARRESDGLTMPYTFLGPVDYVSHKGQRPIAFVWKLRRAMPADFFRAAKVASA